MFSVFLHNQLQVSLKLVGQVVDGQGFLGRRCVLEDDLGFGVDGLFKSEERVREFYEGCVKRVVDVVAKHTCTSHVKGL